MRIFCYNSGVHHERHYPQMQFELGRMSVQELYFATEIKEKHLSHMLKMLLELGKEFPTTNIESVLKQKSLLK